MVIFFAGYEKKFCPKSIFFAEIKIKACFLFCKRDKMYLREEKKNGNNLEVPAGTNRNLKQKKELRPDIYSQRDGKASQKK